MKCWEMKSLIHSLTPNVDDFGGAAEEVRVILDLQRGTTENLVLVC